LESLSRASKIFFPKWASPEPETPIFKQLFLKISAKKTGYYTPKSIVIDRPSSMLPRRARSKILSSHQNLTTY